MKGSIPRFTLLGSNSGRNVGDAAILASILDVLTQEMPDAEFFVPTTHTTFIKTHYEKKYNVKAVNIMPWTLSLRFLGLPTFRCIAKSDAALICDGIIFGKKLWNPAFNWLITLIFVVPWARLMGCKMVCYSTGIGPFPCKWSRRFARWVVQGCDIVIMRENDSKKLCEDLGVTRQIHVTGDAAFLNQVSSPERGSEILKTEGVNTSKPLLGININSYFDAWLAKDEKFGSTEKFITTMADSIRAANKKLGDVFEPLIFSTHPMDEAVAYDLARNLGAKVINNTTYLSHDMQAAMKRCELFLGMRFHSVVLASAVEVPVIGLIYMMKVRGFMRDLGCEEYGVELSTITVESLSDTIARGWNEREALKARQKKVIDGLKAGARRAATVLRETTVPTYKAHNNQVEHTAVNG